MDALVFVRVLWCCIAFGWLLVSLGAKRKY
jgi:hypothetical protein